MKEHTIDASNKAIGRVASEAAVLLMGKDSPSFRKNAVSGSIVTIINASKIKYDPKKLEEKTYVRYSGHPGGLSIRTMQDMIKVKGYRGIFEKAF
jgi:large subunit ribosomal protein L13